MKVILLICLTLLFSCTPGKEDVQPYSTKLIFYFDPSFDETSIITYLDSNNQKTLKLLIKKDFFRNGSSEGIDDTLYYKSTVLNSSSRVQSLIDQLKEFSKQKDIVILDGMDVGYTLVTDKDTLRVNYRSPSKEDPIAYRNIKSVLQFGRDSFADSIVTGYFSIINDYMGEERFDKKLVTPFLLLREKKYPGRIKFNP
jgi:hypothetical protein